MKFLFFFLIILPAQLFSQAPSTTDIARWNNQAKKVTIYRDNYGVPHIYGKTDADAVFGLLYAQCEDDFARVEMNYIEKLGRLAEVKGEKMLYDDLLIRLVIDQDEAKKDYAKAPAWLKKLCIAFADGINYYLYKHPQVNPALLKRFEPWFPMLWTDGSIGAISTADITVAEIKNFYSGDAPIALSETIATEKEYTGSNGFAFSPKITDSRNAILYINPHVTFYFRPEVHMVSEEGLNVYGAVTWGQIFIYQGFNERCGWMHTSSAVDAADVYVEKITKKNSQLFYEYEGEQKLLKQQKIVLNYKNGASHSTKTIKAFFTGHGPVMAKRNDQWLSLKADNRLANGLQQCWLRTKAKGLDDFKKTLDLKGNISNNTVYADAEGNIAYWHGNRIPKRDSAYDWSKPVDGSSKATEWKGYHSIDQTVHSINPVNGWLQNCNSTPFTVAGINSPKKENYPVYMAPDGENFRGINAVRTLSETKTYNIYKVIAAGYDTRIAAFEVLIPALIKSFEAITTNDSLYVLKEAVDILQQWDFRSAESSIATTIAIEWGDRVLPAVLKMAKEQSFPKDDVIMIKYFAEKATPLQMLTPLKNALDNLENKFGTWKQAWGAINRFQRISPAIDNVFDDTKPSLPMAFASSAWGQLPSFVSRTYPGTQKRYGYHGNSFICAVEFGKKIKARSLLAGGNSGDPTSAHFFDQADMYSKGSFKDVLFYKEDVLKHVKKKYRPWEF